MRIVVDAFGGDYAPKEVVLGCIEALNKNPDLHLVLAGDKDKLEQELLANSRAKSAKLRIKPRQSPKTVRMIPAMSRGVFSFFEEAPFNAWALKIKASTSA